MNLKEVGLVNPIQWGGNQTSDRTLRLTPDPNRPRTAVIESMVLDGEMIHVKRSGEEARSVPLANVRHLVKADAPKRPAPPPAPKIDKAKLLRRKKSSHKALERATQYCPCAIKHHWKQKRCKLCSLPIRRL